MALCKACGLDMNTAEGCVPFVKISGKMFRRIPFVDSRDLFGEVEDGAARCGDCNALAGHYHHWLCDWEVCPSCGGQFLSCDCDVDGLFESDEDV